MMRKKYSFRQRLIMAVRQVMDVNDAAKCSVTCPGCGSSNVSGGGGGPYSCGNCGSIWQ
jgi:ribosomal protein L37AE/L43A